MNIREGSKVIGKEINFIDLKNHLIDLDAREITSHLHEDYEKILNNPTMFENGEPIGYSWETDKEGVIFSPLALKRAAESEQSRIGAINIGSITNAQDEQIGYKIIMYFEDKNRISFLIDEESKFIQLLDFLCNYKTPA